MISHPNSEYRNEKKKKKISLSLKKRFLMHMKNFWTFKQSEFAILVRLILFMYFLYK